MSAQSSEGAEPNLTPILDMVFQLITFFMLVVNFKGATLDQSLKLPVLGSARPIDWEPGQEPLILNVDTEGQVRIFGTVIDVEELMAKEAKLTKAMMRAKGEESDGNVPTPVVLRADRNVPFSRLNHVIKVCQKNGYHNFQLSAMTRVEGG
jgi:biopolymer transport protein ExbD